MRAAGAVLLAAALVASCAERRDPIEIQGARLTVTNDTGSRWSDVEIWINDHYRFTVPAIEDGRRVMVPLDGFVAGFGQRFDSRQRVRGVLVRARDEAGRPVRVVWGTVHGR
ncbi:MAG TPA: hypothetical protein VNI83_04710 [Vicinamibacterales bacterium]|nr:hypothetical protein [Vicinamibacterales bacterium]